MSSASGHLLHAATEAKGSWSCFDSCICDSSGNGNITTKDDIEVRHGPILQSYDLIPFGQEIPHGRVS